MQRNNLPKNNELVIHLRTGDVIELNWYLEKDYIQIIQKYINQHKIKKVTFCTAFHYGNNVTQGLWIYTDEKHTQNINKLNTFFTKILEQFKDIEFDVKFDVKSSTNIDDDFIYMVMSKYFVKDNGGFSHLIKELNSYKNHN